MAEHLARAHSALPVYRFLCKPVFCSYLHACKVFVIRLSLVINNSIQFIRKKNVTQTLKQCHDIWIKQCNQVLSQREVPGARTLLLQHLNIYTYIYLSIYTIQLVQLVPPPYKILATHLVTMLPCRKNLSVFNEWGSNYKFETMQRYHKVTM